MNKKNLVIDTNIYEADDLEPSTSSIKVSYKQKMESACFLEKQLSIILGRRFIKCWEQLKSLVVEQSQQRGTKILRREKQAKILDKVADISESYNYKSLRMRRGLMGQKGIKGDIVYRRQINQKKRDQLAFERAKLLSEIVDKLKNVRQKPNKERQHSYMLQKILKVERDLQQIKSLKVTRKQENTSREIYSKNLDKIQKDSIDQDPVQQNMIKQFLTEIEAIKADILEIRRNNSLIIKQQTENNFTEVEEPAMFPCSYDRIQNKQLQSTSIILPRQNQTKIISHNLGYQSQQNFAPFYVKQTNHQPLNSNQLSKSLSYRQHILKGSNDTTLPITHSSIYTQKGHHQSNEAFTFPSGHIKVGNNLTQHSIFANNNGLQGTPEKSKRYLNVTYGKNVDNNKKQVKNNYTTTPTYSSIHTKQTESTNKQNFFHLPQKFGGQSPVYIHQTGWCFACKRNCRCNQVNPEK